ncbi:hypothetical protein PN456_05060 [Nodularia spumigena CS-586/05]|uniref:hypothetical protein n=1 Tax=Nodularia spumigena TaxID=70799 RepID=UPI00232DA389|nr:hypothetical protein [Nodularia spumigena]MDB9368328.1 hypothetical protein [Nodularia spumigena CS-586/05]
MQTEQVLWVFYASALKPHQILKGKVISDRVRAACALHSVLLQADRTQALRKFLREKLSGAIASGTALRAIAKCPPPNS